MAFMLQVVQRRIDLMVAEGIEFQTGVHIGRDVSAKQLLEYNDAVVLCLGSTWPRDLNIPGLIFTLFVLHEISFLSINL